MVPVFEVQNLQGSSYFGVRATWPSGDEELLIGVLVCRDAAQRWIDGRSHLFLRD